MWMQQDRISIFWQIELFVVLEDTDKITQIKIEFDSEVKFCFYEGYKIHKTMKNTRNLNKKRDFLQKRQKIQMKLCCIYMNDIR